MHISKFKAFTIHLGISLLIFSILMYLLVFHWFPDALFFIDGGWKGVRLIATVDIVLGPILTLLFYKPGKPKVLLDMSIIASVQIAALTFGIYTTLQQRTAVIAFLDGRFVTTSVAAVHAGNREMLAANQPIQPLDAIGTQYPLAVYLDKPQGKEYSEYISSVLKGLPELQERSHHFRPLAGNLDRIASFELTPEKQTEELQRISSRYFTRHTLDPDDFQIYGLKARFGFGILVINPKTQQIEKILQITPP